MTFRLNYLHLFTYVLVSISYQAIKALLYNVPTVSKRVEEIFGQIPSAHMAEAAWNIHARDALFMSLVPGVGGVGGVGDDDARSMETHDRA